MSISREIMKFGSCGAGDGRRETIVGWRERGDGKGWVIVGRLPVKPEDVARRRARVATRR